jgi:glycosyltransferase involved in cell wall biosynthesis
MNTAHRPLSIAHVTGESGFSGGEVQVFLLMEGLRKRGHRNLLVCPPDSASAREAQRSGFEIRCARMASNASLCGALRICAHLRACRPDLVHLHTGRADWLGGLAAWQLALPAITTRRMDRPVSRGLRKRFLYRRVVRRAVAISPAVRERLIRGGVAPETTRVIPSAVDPDATQPRAGRSATRAREDLKADTPCLLVLVSLVARKGIDVLLDALAQLDVPSPQPVLWIAGDGPERGALEQRARALGLTQRVRFLGQREDAGDLLAACDVFVLPSRLEGLGVAALEAMAAARPVVASAVGGLAEAVVHERTGLLVPPEDPGALAAALARLLRDPSLRARLGDAGPARVREKYTSERMVEAYEALYAEVLAEGGRP